MRCRGPHPGGSIGAVEWATQHNCRHYAAAAAAAAAVAAEGCWRCPSFHRAQTTSVCQQTASQQQYNSWPHSINSGKVYKHKLDHAFKDTRLVNAIMSHIAGIQ